MTPAPSPGAGAAEDELGFQAVEDRAEAELEGVRSGAARVVGGGGVEAGAQPRELRRDLPAPRPCCRGSRFGVTAVAAELLVSELRGGRSEGVAEHEREDSGRGLVGLARR